jgi:hypothetical protein
MKFESGISIVMNIFHFRIRIKFSVILVLLPVLARGFQLDRGGSLYCSLETLLNRDKKRDYERGDISVLSSLDLEK